MLLHILGALVSGLLVDVLATLVFHYTAQNRAVPAATVNVAVNACVLFVFVDVNTNTYIAIPYLVGLWIGGIIGIEIKKRLE